MITDFFDPIHEEMSQFSGSWSFTINYMLPICVHIAKYH